MSLTAPPAASGASVHVGGAQGRARVVFNLDKPLRPVVTQNDQALIVNFPDMVGSPVTLPESGGVEAILFDGKAANITLKGPFTYRDTYTDKPMRYTLDIKLNKEADLPCPIVNIQTSTGPRGLTVDVYLHEDLRPEVRYAKNRRLFLLFKGGVNCEGLEDRISKVPGLAYSGATKILGGTALAISLAGEKGDMEVRTPDRNNKLTLEISSGSTLSRSGSFAVAQGAYDRGDVASAIRMLKPYSGSLDARESILLGRAYWKIAHPYYLGAYSPLALKYMNSGIQAMAPGVVRETFLLEYARMLLRSARYADAMKYVKFLKGSSSPDIAAEACLLEIDITNRKKRYQDAFVQDRQMQGAFHATGIPARLVPYCRVVQGDTLLGLNAPQRALDLYREALNTCPGLFADDPGLYARMAEASYKLGDYASARTWLLLAVNLSPREARPDYLVSLGDCAYQLGQKDMAIGVLSQVENMAGQTESNVVARLKTARFIQEKDLSENKGRLSSKGFRQILLIYEDLKNTREYQEGPLGAIIKIRIAQLYALKEDWNNALEWYKLTWTDTKKGDPVHTYAQAEAERCIVAYATRLDAAGKYDLVYDIYVQYQDSFMKGLANPEAAFLLGKALTRLGYLDQARPLLLVCLGTTSPRTGDALAWLAALDFQRGDYSRALRWNERCLLEHPDGACVPKALALKGELLYYTNRFAEAVPWLEKSGGAGGERAPFDLFLLADAQGRLGNTAQEAAALDRVIASGTASPVMEKALYLRANLYQDEGNPTQARALYRRLLDTYPRSAYREWAQYHLAEAWAKEGNVPEATRLLTALIQGTRDATLRTLATGALGSISLGTDVDDYTRLLGRFGGK